MQTELLCYLTGYLSYRCNQRIVKLVAEIMQMSLLKEHKLVKVIEERNLIGLIY